MKEIIAKKNYTQCGVVTSYIYTFIYLYKDSVMVYSWYIKNNEFHKKFYTIFEKIIRKEKIDFFNVFLGPAPLLSSRTTLIAMQAFFIAKKISIVVTKGYEYYKHPDFQIIIIQNFAGFYTLIENNVMQESLLLSDIESRQFTDKKIALVSRENHEIKIGFSYSYLLFPFLKKIIQDGESKFRRGSIIKKIQEIRFFM